MNFLLDGIKTVFKNFKPLSRPYFSLEENVIKFKISTDTFYKYNFDYIETKTRHDSYVLEAYTIDTGDLHIEYIHTDEDVSWNGQALSFLASLIKDNLKVDEMKLLEKKDFNHYTFLTYRIDNKYNLNIIYIYEEHREVFIVDTKGDLYENLLKAFQKSYSYGFEKNEQFSLSMNISLVKYNSLNNYFSLN